MKRIWVFLLLVLLFGCTATQTIEHPDWDNAWFRMGDIAAAEPMDRFVLNESNDVLSIAGIYYATWTAGEGTAIKNAQGDEATAYDAQIYWLVKECDSEEAASAEIADWIAREANAYEVEESALTVNGQDYRVLTLQRALSENPYDHGIAAFGMHGSNAISVELLCRSDWDGDAEKALRTFLNGLHF